MAFSFEPFLAISAGHFMAVSAGPEQHRLLYHSLCTNVAEGAGFDLRCGGRPLSRL